MFSKGLKQKKMLGIFMKGIMKAALWGMIK